MCYTQCLELLKEQSTLEELLEGRNAVAMQRQTVAGIQITDR